MAPVTARCTSRTLCGEGERRQAAYRSGDRRQRREKEEPRKKEGDRPNFRSRYGAARFAATFVPGNNRLRRAPYARQRKTASSGSCSRKATDETWRRSKGD